MSADIMPCGCEGHLDNVDLCQYPALEVEAEALRARVADLTRAGIEILWADGGGNTAPFGWHRNPYINIENHEKLTKRVAELEAALKTERKWTHELGSDSRRQQAMLDQIATLLGVVQRNDLTDLPAILSTRLDNATEAYAKLLSTTSMAGTLDAAELKQRVQELEGAIWRLLRASEPVSLHLQYQAILARRQEYNDALGALRELGIDLEKKP